MWTPSARTHDEGEQSLAPITFYAISVIERGSSHDPEGRGPGRGERTWLRGEDLAPQQHFMVR